MFDWDEMTENPVEAYDDLKNFLSDSNNKFILKQLAKGLAVTLGIAAGKFVVTQYGRHRLIKQQDGTFALLEQ